MALFSIVGDIFRDREMSGGLRAVWIVCLIFFPFITALIYLIVRGRGMTERAVARPNATRRPPTTTFARWPASPADEIARAKALLDAGTISPAEYEALKAKALA